MNSKLTITALQIEGFKKIVAMSIDPETGKPVILTGDNEAGKSSVLDSIMFALTGQGAEKPLNDQSFRGKIVVTLTGEERTLEVQRTFTNQSKALVVRDLDGKQLPRAQEVLNGIIGALAFDPEKFVRMKERERAEALRLAAGLDFTDLDEARKRAFEERTTVNRLLKEAETEKKALGASPEDPGEPKSVRDIMERLDGLRKTSYEHQQAVSGRDRAAEEVKEAVVALEAAQARLEGCRAQFEHLDKKVSLNLPAYKEAQTRIPELEAEVEGLEEQAAKANAYRADREKRATLSGRITRLSKEQAELNKAIKEVDEAKQKAIKESKLPEGVTFDEEGGVLFSGRPFSDLNTAKQWETATQLAVLQDPDLGVVFIREAALINREHLSYLIDWAKERGVQLWLEKFQEQKSEIGIHIVEGEIAAIDGKEMPK